MSKSGSLVNHCGTLVDRSSSNSSGCTMTGGGKTRMVHIRLTNNW